MSYKYSKGAQVIGDLKAADDVQRNTLIDFGEDQIDFQTLPIFPIRPAAQAAIMSSEERQDLGLANKRGTRKL